MLVPLETVGFFLCTFIIAQMFVRCDNKIYILLLVAILALRIMVGNSDFQRNTMMTHLIEHAIIILRSSHMRVL
jgi:hypothetical protein